MDEATHVASDGAKTRTGDIVTGGVSAIKMGVGDDGTQTPVEVAYMTLTRPGIQNPQQGQTITADSLGRTPAKILAWGACLPL